MDMDIQEQKEEKILEKIGLTDGEEHWDWIDESVSDVFDETYEELTEEENGRN